MFDTVTALSYLRGYASQPDELSPDDLGAVMREATEDGKQSPFLAWLEQQRISRELRSAILSYRFNHPEV